MTSYLKRAPIVVLAIIMVSFLIWPMVVQANMLVNTAQGAFAPAAQEATPQIADLSSQQPGALRYEANKVYTGERISLDFQNADIHNIIRIIGEVSGKNIVISDAVSGKVTLKLKDVPWDQALDIVLASRSLGVEESGNVLTVYDMGTLMNMRAGRERVAAERAAALAVAPLSKKVFTPKYAPISSVTDEISKLKTSRGKIVAIGNDIYVEDEAGSIATMSEVFMRIDRVARQILIEARIIEASSQFANNLGINWGAQYSKLGSLSGVAGQPEGRLISRAAGLLWALGSLIRPPACA